MSSHFAGDVPLEISFSKLSISNNKKGASCRECNEINCLLKCITCNVRYCNAKKQGQTESHIRKHIRNSTHFLLSTDDRHPCGAKTINCVRCGGADVNVLGFIAPTVGTKKIVVCKKCVSNISKLNYNIMAFIPFFSDNKVNANMFKRVLMFGDTLKESGWDAAFKKAKATIEEMKKDKKKEEKMKKKNNNAKSKSKIELPKEPMISFSSTEAYAEYFNVLVCSERNLEFVDTVVQTTVVENPNLLENETLMEDVIGRKLHVPALLSGGIRLKEMDEVVFYPVDEERNEGKNDVKALVVRIFKDPPGTIGITLGDPSEKFACLHETTVKMQKNFNSVVFDRQSDALHSFKESGKEDGESKIASASKNIVDSLLRVTSRPENFDYAPEQVNVPGLHVLNSVQENVVRKVLQKPLSLIQGPPGTGKTGVSATIIYHMAKNLAEENEALSKGMSNAEKALQRKNNVLACAPSNIAVDEMAARIAKTGLNVLRFYSNRTPYEKSSNNPLSQVARLLDRPEVTGNRELRKKIREMFTPKIEHPKNNDRKRHEKTKKADLISENPELADGVHAYIIKILSEIINDADVICCTCSTSACIAFSGLKFRCVLVDECTQATEPQVLVPLMKGSKHVVLVGDHRQLPPVIKSEKLAKHDISRSMFERLIDLGHPVHQLDIQYRMHPAISSFPNTQFYDGAITDGIFDVHRRVMHRNFQIKTLCFYHCEGRERKRNSSFYNLEEVQKVVALVDCLFSMGISMRKVGVITPYEAQRWYISNRVTARKYNGLEVANVDAFQGREKDFIILTCVRSNGKSSIGFLKDERRVNVAITRAKFGLYFVGDTNHLSKNNLWKSLIDSYKEKGLIEVGHISSVNQLLVT